MFGTFLVDILLCIVFNDRFVGAQTASPCPQIFSYEYDFKQQLWYGEIHAHPPYGIFHIDMTLVVAATITNVCKSGLWLDLKVI
jgi:hypothetical protein